MQAWVDGQLLPLERATVNVLDAGFRTGEGVFETLRAYHGHPFRLDRHLHRATAGATRLGFEAPPLDDMARAVQATVDANRHVGDDLAVRLTVTPGPLDPHAPWPLSTLGQPTVVVTAHALQLSAAPYEQGVRAVTVPWMRELPDVKAVSFLAASMARRRARAFGADEALLCDQRGNVVEGASSNLFVAMDGRLRTPPLDAGLLAGVTRATVLELAAALELPADEAPLPLTSVLGADEVFLTASTRELVAVVRVDDTRIGTGRPGPVTGRLLASYRDRVTLERHAGPSD